MKKSLIATLVAVPLLSLSSMAFAAEPVLLTATQMDEVTAGLFNFKWAQINQGNASAVTTVQLNLLTAGAGNVAAVGSGNNAVIRQ